MSRTSSTSFPFIYSSTVPYVSVSVSLELIFHKINDELLRVLKALVFKCFVTFHLHFVSLYGFVFVVSGLCELN